MNEIFVTSKDYCGTIIYVPRRAYISIYNSLVKMQTGFIMHIIKSMQIDLTFVKDPNAKASLISFVKLPFEYSFEFVGSNV